MERGSGGGVVVDLVRIGRVRVLIIGVTVGLVEGRFEQSLVRVAVADLTAQLGMLILEKRNKFRQRPLERARDEC